MSPCSPLNRAKHSGWFFPSMAGRVRTGIWVSLPLPSHRWTFMGRPPPSTVKFAWPCVASSAPLPGLGAFEGPSRPAVVSCPGQHIPVSRWAPCCTRHTPSPPNSWQRVPCAGLRVRGRGWPKSQASSEQGRGTAFGEITEAEGLRSRGEQDS